MNLDALEALDLPTFDEIGPVLMRGLDEDEAMSAFQLLIVAGYRIIAASKLEALAASLPGEPSA